MASTVTEGMALAVGVAALGRLIQGPLAGLPAEDRLNARFARSGTPAWDRATWVLSTYSDTVPTIVTALALGGWQWRGGGGAGRAWAPVTAIAVETVVFMTAAAAVGRPRPDVRRLDRPAPTSSFPSGHTGASTALHLTLAGLMREADAPPAASAAVQWAVPPAVAFSRVYRGMHHPSDVLVGIAVGTWASRATRRLLRSH